MNPLSLAALATQTRLLAPYRYARLRQLARNGEAPISVPFYHRVADERPNDWTISRRGFQRHVEYCQQNFELIDLAEVQRRVRDRDSCTPAVSFTFDDGYSENCDFALPLLIERKVPCTYFVSTENVIHGKGFGHDCRCPLAVNSKKQVREMSDAGIEIGCHTRSHVDFAKVHDLKIVRREIVDAKAELEQIIGRAVRYFAFPFGLPEQLTQMAIEAVHSAGYQGFCSAYGAYNLVGQDSFHIRRVHGDPEFARLVNWLSYCPRKIRNQPEIRYFLPPLRSFEATLGYVNSSL